VGVRIALAGDTMLGRGVAEVLHRIAPQDLVAGDVATLMRDADLCLLNLECCISERGERWPAPGKPFFFRAPPSAVRTLRHLGVGCVTLANNHALDYGRAALEDTLDHLRAADIAIVGAGRHGTEARSPVVVQAGGLRLGVVAVTDHPEDFAARHATPGVAYAGLEHGIPPWLLDTITRLRGETDAVLVTPHWGPNMVPRPVRHVREAAEAFVAAGATVVAGHSAHVPHGVRAYDGAVVLYDLGDFLDDYAVHPELRNDLGLLWFVTLEEGGPLGVEAVPLALDYCFTRRADDAETAWIRDRLRTACAAEGTVVHALPDRLAVQW
jgi:poly-gamma-glutamate capsule biosynthesis protein CapA/YwtB (metallophosphatase superfamily)